MKETVPLNRAFNVDIHRRLNKARESAKIAELSNVEFREGIGEELRVPGYWADVVISNGVLNLMLDRLTALAEMACVLKPGGRCRLAFL